MKKVVFSLCGLVISLLLAGCNNKIQKEDGTKIELNDNLIFELDSKINRSDLIVSITNGELIGEDEKIDTSKLGENTITVYYIDKEHKKKEFNFKITVVDTIKPVIECKKEIVTTIGKEVDLLNDVKVMDNSGIKIAVEIVGDYDFNKVGNYNLKYVAKDKSNNRAEEEFTLIVKDANIKLNSAYYGENDQKILSISFRDDNIAFAEYDTGCTMDNPCGGYAEYGPYKIEGNKLTISLKYGFDLEPELDSYELDNIKEFEFIVVNENTIKNDKYEFNIKE